MLNHIQTLQKALQNNLETFEKEMEMSVPSLYIRGFKNFSILYDEKIILVEFFDVYAKHDFRLDINKCTGNELEFITKLFLLICAAKRSGEINNLFIANQVPEKTATYPDYLRGLANFDLYVAVDHYRQYKNKLAA